MPDTLWVTDATEGWSVEGRSAVFAIIDHASGEAWCDASLRMDRFKTHEQLRRAARDLGRRYKEHWLLERHGYRTPIEARQHLLDQGALACSGNSPPRCPVNWERRTASAVDGSAAMAFIARRAAHA